LCADTVQLTVAHSAIKSQNI